MTYKKPNGSNTYREQQILTASPARLVAMLYEAAITSLRRAVKAIEAGDIKARYTANAKAVEIIEHLSLTLDTDKGGEIAANLERLYPFMIGHLINVDLHNDPKAAQEVIALLEPLHDSWRTLDRQMAQGANPTAPTPAPAAGDAPADLNGPPGSRIAATA